MIRNSPALRIAATTAAIIVLSEGAQAATGGVPMTGSNPPHQWFDWIFFAIVIPWLVFALWEYVRTGNHK